MNDMENHLYEFRMKLLRGEGCDMPEGIDGAHVACYASASTYEAAVKKGVVAASHMHYVFDNIEGDVREIPVASWGAYVEKVWPEFASHFPSQDELPSLVEQGIVFFGPFAGFKM
ncbi:hypothetical protein F6X37_24445 [Paraburkholderia sp. 31.1]|uniref:hypothetical protein n=1 Tax=Paraburkholderia sp. 31.1 TaxID=2615205 RepID=UPI0016550EE5|nr:hypothetical protein [Paraburkholderia sp. 31.1]MBC8724623.1 hypothetical protein [Paraburkholderia sp. 31.1]